MVWEIDSFNADLYLDPDRANDNDSWWWQWDMLIFEQGLMQYEDYDNHDDDNQKLMIIAASHAKGEVQGSLWRRRP